MLPLLHKLTIALGATMLFVALQLSTALAHHGGPHATITLWPIADPTACDPMVPPCDPANPTPGLIGFNPNETDEDPNGATLHVVNGTNKLTMVTNINNALPTNGRPNGLIFWNPATNIFKWYGVAVGFSSGVDVNLRQLNTQYNPPGNPAGKAFQYGDVWSAVRGDPQTALYHNSRGTNDFRHYSIVGQSGVIGANAVAVHPNGDVFFTAEDPGFGAFIGRLDPETNNVTTWLVGSSAGYLAIDSYGMVYATVSNALALTPPADAIVRLNPNITMPTVLNPNVLAWAVPVDPLLPLLPQFCANPCVDGLGPFMETPDGIDLDSAGNVWFVETSSNEIGRLEPNSGRMTEFTGIGVDNPQMVGVRGSGSSVEAFFTEGDGESVSRVIPHPQHNGPTFAAPVPKAVAPVPCLTLLDGRNTCQAIHLDESIDAQQTKIQPLVYTRPAVPAPGAYGTEIHRWAPMPAPPLPDVDGVVNPNDNCTNIASQLADPDANPAGRACHPSGMTDVTGTMTVYGSYLDPIFQGTSAVFRLYDPPDGAAPEEPPLIPALAGWKRISAAGSIPAANGKKATFSIALDKKSSSATPTGRIRYANPATGEKVVSTAIQSVTVAGNAATITGTCTNNGAACSFTIVVTDNGVLGLPEMFSIVGQGVGPAVGNVSNGNVTIYSN
jgi:streptogramin lyase